VIRRIGITPLPEPKQPASSLADQSPDNPRRTNKIQKQHHEKTNNPGDRLSGRFISPSGTQPA
jgi:hypothetical protein